MRFLLKGVYHIFNLMKCKVCNSDTILIQEDVYKCPMCSHTYVNFLGDPIEYHKTAYRKNNHGTRGNDEIKNDIFTENFHSFRKPICENRVLKIKHLINDSDTMFDIGAGGGTFLNVIGNLIESKECQEVSDICVKNLNMQGYVTYQGDFCNMEIPKKYDLVTCFHVLEHIQYLESFVNAVSKITNKYLVIEVPVNRVIPVPNKNWDGHYHYFSKKSIRDLFSKEFEILSIEEGVQSPAILVTMRKL